MTDLDRLLIISIVTAMGTGFFEAFSSGFKDFTLPSWMIVILVTLAEIAGEGFFNLLLSAQ